jgi:N-acetylneuraminic acid mutarotase
VTLLFRAIRKRRATVGRLGAVAVLSTMALAVTVVPSQAAPAGPASAAAAGSASTTSPSYQPVCGTAKPGTFSCLALRRTNVKSGRLAANTAPAGYGPGDLQSAYSLPSDGGSGQTVAIVDAFDDPTAEADLAVYRQQYGLPPCTTANGCFSKVDQQGGTDYPPANGDWDGEISLDLDMVSAVAPEAHILLVEADDDSSTNLAESVDEAVTLGAKFVSNSYGSDYTSAPGSGEDPSDPTTMDAYYDHPGVAVIASAGDSGYGVGYPAASPYVTSVGGTSLTPDPGSARGWSETAWAGTGSGCSLYEPKPAFQHDAGCAMRSVTDVSADADPNTGVAVYESGLGWNVYGGTSVASPLIAGVYADAGTPAAGTYPNSYPYAAGTGLNDVTSGTNGDCTTGYECNAVKGYDGPTGLGTPDGLQAFRTGPHGTLAGAVTSRATGKPVAGATVSDGTDVTHTTTSGRYTLALPAGPETLTVTAFGYATGTAKLNVAAGVTAAENLTLAQVPSETVSGTVTDGSGQDWPLYAEITVAGDPGAVWTNPVTGRYQVTLPRNTDYTLDFAPAEPGYDEVTKTVHVAQAPLTVNAAATADPWTATAPGYTLTLTGSTQTFDSTTAAPAGWSVVNASGTGGGWQFNDPGGEGNLTGGSGGFAIADGSTMGAAASMDTSLVTSVYNFTGDTQPEVGFDTMWWLNSVFATAEVQASDDGGATWTTVWTVDPDTDGYVIQDGHYDVPLTAYAGKPSVQLRFHLTNTDPYLYWGIDDVFVGQRDFLPASGGLVAGTVRDANTGQGADDATVTDASSPQVQAQTAATPEDPSLPGGYYSLFVPGPGKHTLTTAKFDYVTATKTVNVRAHSTAEADYRLTAGQLRVTPGSVTASADLGGSSTRTLTVTNTGTAPATLQIGEQAGPASSPDAAQGAPLQRIAGNYSPGVITGQSHQTPTASPSDASASAAPADDEWQSGPTLPDALMDNVADAYDGKIYSGFGDDGLLSFGAASNNLSVMDPAAGTWTQLAPATDGRQAPGHGIIDGKLYIAGGFTGDGATDPKLEIYDIASNTWTTGPAEPAPAWGGASAVLDGKLYLIGGCTDSDCDSTDAASVYDPSTSTWSQIAPYPVSIAWNSCAGLGGKLYCAGGTTISTANISSAYVYDPAAGTWSALPDMPVPLWGSAYAAANGLLVISGGVTSGALTNQSFAYNPATSTWTTLPNANDATYRGAGALGFYKIGGSPDGFEGGTDAEYLPGYDVDPTATVPWLAESATQLTLRPHQRVTVTVTLDASASAVTQPGTYTARLVFGSSTPYPLPPVPVTLTVTPSSAQAAPAKNTA